MFIYKYKERGKKKEREREEKKTISLFQPYLNGSWPRPQWPRFPRQPRRMERLRNIDVRNCATSAVSISGTAQLLDTWEPRKFHGELP